MYDCSSLKMHLIKLPLDIIKTIFDNFLSIKCVINVLSTCKFFRRYCHINKYKTAIRDLLCDKNATYMTHAENKQYLSTNNIIVNAEYNFKLNCQIHLRNYAQSVKLDKNSIIMVRHDIMSDKTTNHVLQFYIY